MLRALEEEGIRPDVIYGTSMGAVVGAMYASGYTSAQIEEQVTRMNWLALFSPTPGEYEWRTITLARPWLTLEGVQGTIKLPGGFVEPERLEFEMARSYLRADAIAQGDFDRLPIPFRAVASDANTLADVTLNSGSVAQAVRASLAIPVVFPPVWLDNRLLVDGGLAANLPLAQARKEGFDALLAVDVALPLPGLTENSSALEIGLAILDRLDKRGQPDSLIAGEQLIWLKLEGFSAADFLAGKEMIARAYEDAAPQVREFARKIGSAAADSARTFEPPQMPPIRGPVAWKDRDGQEAKRAETAGDEFGELPSDSFYVRELAPGLGRVYRSGLLNSAWPTFRVNGDSTDLSFIVNERKVVELALAAGWDLDRKVRGQAVLSLRPRSNPLPIHMVLGGTARTLGSNVFVGFEPRALDRGSGGWFVRGNFRRSETRIFSAEDEYDIVENNRFEGFVGAQLAPATGDIIQVGGGYGTADDPSLYRAGPIANFRSDAAGAFSRHFRFFAQFGPDGYESGDATLSVTALVRPLTIRPSISVAFASETAPLDEWPSLGGPETLGGLRYGEWLGRSSFSASLTVMHRTGRLFDVFAALQAGRVEDAIGRPDLSGAIRFAGDFGVQIDVPLGPLRIDWGITEGGQNRVDLAFGQYF